MKKSQMSTKRVRKVYVARDMNNQLRVYLTNPRFNSSQGSWYSRNISWQIEYSEYSGVPKGEKKLVRMIYTLEELGTPQAQVVDSPRRSPRYGISVFMRSVKHSI